MNKLNITDLDKLKITKVRPWSVNFIYDGQKYFLHDKYLYKNEDKNIRPISNIIILLKPYDFIRLKKRN